MQAGTKQFIAKGGFVFLSHVTNECMAIIFIVVVVLLKWGSDSIFINISIIPNKKKQIRTYVLSNFSAKIASESTDGQTTHKTTIWQ